MATDLSSIPPGTAGSQKENKSLVIAINPIPDHCLGNLITFGGTTNLPAGKNLSLSIMTTDFHGCQKTIHPCGYPDTVNAICCLGGFNRSVAVIPGGGGMNTWVYSVNTSDYDFRPGGYFVHVRSGTAYTDGLFTVQEPVNSFPPWIAVDPIPHHYSGDIITFNGTTNLAPGEMISISVYEGVFHTCPKSPEACHDSVRHCCDGHSAIITVLPGTCGLNTWSWDVDTSQYGFRADGEYIISASGRTGAAENSSVFTLSGIPAPDITLNLPVSDSGGSALRLSGQVNTGNGPDEKLVLTLSSDSGRVASFTFPVYRNGTGYSWNISVNKSSVAPYNFLTVNVSSQTSPAISIRRVFLYNNEPAYYPYNSAGP